MNPLTFLAAAILLACTTSENPDSKPQPVIEKKEASAESSSGRKFRGAFSNGMKGDSIFFDLSADRTRLENLTFKGYWRCSGRLESMMAGPEGSFAVVNNKVADHITEPPDGGSTAWRFDLEADIRGNKASGTFRMAINNMGCDTYKLNWTAQSY